jgi:hypothetical protein
MKASEFNMKIKQTARVEWSEVRRDQGSFLVIAEWNGIEWEFWDRDSWEVQWYPLASRPDLIAKAEALLKESGMAGARKAAA